MKKGDPELKCLFHFLFSLRATLIAVTNNGTDADGTETTEHDIAEGNIDSVPKQT